MKPTKRTWKGITYEIGSGNVFKDLGLPNAEELLTKSSLLWEIHVAVRARKLSQAKAAAIMGITQPQVSMLLGGEPAGFSVQRLTRLLMRLGKTVTIVVSDDPPRPGAPHLPVVRDSAGVIHALANERIEPGLYEKTLRRRSGTASITATKPKRVARKKRS